MIGKSISHFRIIDKLGQGGMGEVFSAEDSILARKVALKFLPEVLSSDPESLARFEREARVLASLNHPHIAAIYGLEQSDGKRFLVMELVEGETLSQRIAKSPLAVEEALDVCRQIAEGLEAAHEKGIIHRDLKPANVKIMPDGQVKILDFGLAKAFHDAPAAGDASRSPTLTDQMTRPGVILGTAAYMPPEQARGKAVDRRADIWAFGCVLYECLVGTRAFAGETVTETLAAILRGEPDWHALPVEVPQHIRDLLKRCLQKDPAQRLRDIGDIRIGMTTVDGRIDESESAHRGIRRKAVLAWTAASLLIGILIGFAVTSYVRPLARGNAAPSSSPMVISTIKLMPGHSLDGMRRPDELLWPTRTAMCCSRDGRFIVYSAVADEPAMKARTQLYVHRLDQKEARPIPGTWGGIGPFLSPDDKWAGFWAGGKLKKIAIADESMPQELCDAKEFYGAAWGDDGNIWFSEGVSSGLSRVSDRGGTSEAITRPDPQRGEFGHRLPFPLPHGKGVLFTVMRERFDKEPRTAMLDPQESQWTDILESGSDARFSPTGHLVFVRQGALCAVAFNPDVPLRHGTPISLFSNVMQSSNSIWGTQNASAGQFAISGTGLLAYAAGGVFPDMQNSIVYVDQGGSIQDIGAPTGPYLTAKRSPDGRQIAYTTMGRQWQIWIYDLMRGTPRPLTEEGRPTFMAWKGDGRELVFTWSKTGRAELVHQPLEKNAPPEPLSSEPFLQYVGSCSLENVLVFVRHQSDASHDILTMDLNTRRVTPFATSRYSEKFPVFSPNGRWIAYTSDESGQEEVYVEPYPKSVSKAIPVSSRGGTNPLWSQEGRQLFYRMGDQVLVVDLSRGPASPGMPRKLFEQAGFHWNSPTGGWDLAPDGLRFLMIKDEERKSRPVTEMILVQNWTEQYQRLVSAGK